MNSPPHLDELVALADDLLDADIRARREPFQRSLRGRVAELAAKGIAHSGAAVMHIGDGCMDEIVQRSELASAAVKAAAVACDVRFSSGLADALVAAYRKLFEERWGDVQQAFDHAVRGNGVTGDNVGAHGARLEHAAAIASAKQCALLRVFAAERRSRMRNERSEWWQRVGFLVGGATLGAAFSHASDIGTWLAHGLRVAH